MESTNLELKPCDPSSNPYLALGGLLAAGLDGMERKLDSGEPAMVDPDTLAESERTRRHIRRLPASLGEALDALERDEVLCAAMGQVLAREYLASSALRSAPSRARTSPSKSTTTSTSTDAARDNSPRHWEAAPQDCW